MEILVEAPGKWWFKDNALKDNKLSLSAIEVDDEAKKYGQLVIDCMVEAEEYYLNKSYPNCPIPGAANASYAPFWAH